jgi:Tat protein translocase TatB subunit
MFGIGYQEMFIVLVVALVIFGPSRLPELAGQVGRWVRDFRRMSADLTGEFEKTFAEVDEVKKSFKREMQSIQDEVEGIGKSARGDLKKASAKAQGGAKKGTNALKTGSAATARGSTDSGTSTRSASKAGAAARRGANGVGHGVDALNALPIATKADPLADVSFFDLGPIGATNGSAASGDGARPGDVEGALSRVRRRRAAAAYSRHVLK